MTYIIRLRGHDDISVDDVKGEKLQEDWMHYKKAKTSTERQNRNHVVKNLAGFTGQLSDISSFKYSESGEKSTKDTDHQKKIQKINKQDFEHYKSKVDKDPDEKAKDLEFAKGWHQVITGEDTFDIETRKEYIDVQRAFFKENPDRTLPDLKTLNEVINKEKASSTGQADALFRGALARLMTNMIVNDYQHAKNRRLSRKR